MVEQSTLLPNMKSYPDCEEKRHLENLVQKLDLHLEKMNDKNKDFKEIQELHEKANEIWWEMNVTMGALIAKKKQYKKDYLSIILSIIAIVVASTSLFVSSRTQQLSIIDEFITQLAIPAKNSMIHLSRVGSGELGFLITAPFEFTLTNTGNRRLSITQYEIYALNSWGGKYWYSGIDGGLLDSKGNPLHLPLVLDIGVSNKGYILVGMLASDVAIRTLQAINPSSSTISRRDLDVALAKHGIDLFGNKVVLKDYGSDSYIIEGPGLAKKLPKLIVVFHSGKGVVISAEASWYPGY